ncbi:salicylate synthase [Paraburkholderia hayleyella]|uniref:salicylate synthase n=1 Tax=Paraburkholderia hayleyella TaxID=2152889 RepID=UPI0012913A7F|nr:salicylate synthase [Paraburkholderia hayleyella]
METYLQQDHDIRTLPAVALGECPSRWAATFGERTALVAGAERLSYLKLAQCVEQLAAGLHRSGIRRGERALVQLPNSIGFVTVCFALMRLGAIPVLTLPAQRARDIDALARLAEPVAYFIPERRRDFGGFDYRQLAGELAAAHPSLRQIVVDGSLESVDKRSAPFVTLSSVAALGENDDEGEDEGAPDVSPAPGETALLLLSGGTTGTPKLIPRTHADYQYNFNAAARRCGLGADSVYLAVLPAAHNFTLACPGVLGTLACGGTVVLSDSASCDEVMPLIERERVTHVALVPPLARIWVQARAWEKSDLSSLRVVQVGGARLDPELAAQLPQRLGGQLQQVFGMAEGLLCCTALDDPPHVVSNTQGRPLSPDDELRVVDAALRDVPAGAVGELLTRGPYTIRAYYRAPQADARSFTADGFYRTGDLVRLTPEGNLVVEGRIKEQIHRGGEKIPASEIETLLVQVPGVREAVVVAVPDPALGERICAFLLAEGEAPERETLNQALTELGLSDFKRPDQIETLERWPLTAVGKIDKTRLVALALERTPCQAVPAAARTPARGRYAELRVPLTSHPLDLAARLARTTSARRYAVYERGEEWSIGLDAALSLTLTPDGHLCRSDNKQSPTRVAEALDALPFDDWRAYGRVSFEFAHRLHGLGTPASDQALLQLFVPRHEIRLRSGEALIRSLDPGALATLAQQVAAQDAAPALPPGQALTSIEQAGAEATYQAQVAAALREMRAGAYEKVILSRTLDAPLSLDMTQSYLEGRRANTPARSFLLRDGEFEAYGFSPETVVEVDANGFVSTQPLAGTRALTGDATEDERLRRELLRDAKEIAEHAVSVQLALAEMSQICEPGTIGISEFMSVHRRGTVQHLASRVKGQLAAGRCAWDAFIGLFPAVTASGIPKRAALESIRRHERTPRGLYSGAVMIIDSDGALDAALVLRSVFRDGTRCWLQAGAGLVPLSEPAREWTETCEKLASVARHLRAAAGQASPDAR